MAMSSVLLDVKPWDDETDMQKLEEAVRSVQMEGLTWGACMFNFLIFSKLIIIITLAFIYEWLEQVMFISQRFK